MCNFIFWYLTLWILTLNMQCAGVRNPIRATEIHRFSTRPWIPNFSAVRKSGICFKFENCLFFLETLYYRWINLFSEKLRFACCHPKIDWISALLNFKIFPKSCFSLIFGLFSNWIPDSWIKFFWYCGITWKNNNFFTLKFAFLLA